MGAVVTLLLAAGCAESPSAPVSDLLEIRESLASVEPLLTSLPELEAEGVQRVRRGSLGAESQGLLLEAGSTAWEAEGARAAGDEDLAEGLKRAKEEALTRGLLVALGTPRADRSVVDLELALERLAPRWEGTARPQEVASTDVQRALREARRGAERARRALDAGDAGTALLETALAGDVLRNVDPEMAALRAVGAAWRLLERARELAGGAAPPPIARGLTWAENACVDAREALGEGGWRQAIADASRCAGLSRAVIARLMVGVDPDLLSERAAAVVTRATRLLERAREEAGSRPHPSVAEWLTGAEELLMEARRHLAYGEYRRAVQAAQGSAARSTRVLAFLGFTGGGA